MSSDSVALLGASSSSATAAALDAAIASGSDVGAVSPLVSPDIPVVQSHAQANANMATCMRAAFYGCTIDRKRAGLEAAMAFDVDEDAASTLAVPEIPVAPRPHGFYSDARRITTGIRESGRAAGGYITSQLPGGVRDRGRAAMLDHASDLTQFPSRGHRGRSCD